MHSGTMSPKVLLFYYIPSRTRTRPLSCICYTIYILCTVSVIGMTISSQSKGCVATLRRRFQNSMIGARHGHGLGTAWARHGHGIGTAWARHGHSMGAAWGQHGRAMSMAWQV